MPKVSIREIDSTGSETLEYLNYTVLIPGPHLGHYVGKDVKTFERFSDEPVLCTSAKDFPIDLEPITKDDNPVFNKGTYDYKSDIGHLMINELLSKGLTVLYVPAYTLNNKSELTPTVYQNFFEDFEDKGKYDLRFITLGGFNRLEGEDYIGYAKYALKCAGNRGDAVALLDVAQKGYKGSDQEEYEIIDTEDIDNWVQDNFGALAGATIPDQHRDGVSWTNQEKACETYGRYGAIFAPWVVAKFVNDRGSALKQIPGSFNYLACFAKYIQRYKSWFAMSGSIRGVSPYSGITPLINFGDADINVFQVRSGDAGSKADGHVATDIICNIRPYGNIIWGNRTMHPLSKPNNDTGDAAIQLTASSFLNIRQLCIDIKKTLYRAARRFTFEPNSDVLWINFKGAITPLLEEMKANQGIKGYQVIQLQTNKKALLVAKIKIVPIEAVEDFDLTVELSDSIAVTEE